MDFSLTDEQQMIRDSVERFVERDYGFEKRFEIIESPRSYSTEHWSSFAELGWLGIPLPEEAGGFGGSGVETMVLMEPFGAGLVVEPYLPNVVLAGKVLALAGGDTAAQLLSSLIEGDRQVSFGFSEAGTRYNLASVETEARAEDAGYVLNGRKTVVLNAPNADSIIVSARTGGSGTDPEGISLFVVDAEADGVTVQGYKLMNGTCAGEVILDGVRVGSNALLGEADNALPLVERAVDYATAAACNDAYGAINALVQRTADFLKTRKQFGVPIGTFQALQHRVVDMFVEAEQSRSMSYMVSMKVDEEDTEERKRSVSAAKAYINRAARYVGQNAVQLHGGIGVTEELDVGHYFRRLTMFCNLFGDREHHLERFASLTQ